MPRWQRSEIRQEELLTLGLTPEEGFVLSRLSVPLSDSEVVAMTGLDVERVSAILVKLAGLGAVHSDEPSPPAPSEGDPAWLEPLEPDPPPPVAKLDPEPEPVPEESAQEGPGNEGREGASAVEEESSSGDEPDGAQGGVEEELNYRKVYESTFHPLEPHERIAAAQTVRGPELFALCFDQDPNVLRAVVTNPEFGLGAARLIARHHRGTAGLEIVAQRADLLKDANLQRRILANPQVGEALAKRLLNGKRMMDAYKLSINTDFPERTRHIARLVLRSKFGIAQGEERAGIIAATEGRVLAALAGLTLDARATSILCSRSYTSVLFIQNLARFAACPPAILAHLLKQPFVRRTQHLKNMILQHPNVPAEAKRNL